jgi:hypothetical protein
LVDLDMRASLRKMQKLEVEWCVSGQPTQLVFVYAVSDVEVDA